jgi:hypothetical protein
VARREPQRATVSPALLMGGLLAVVILFGGVFVAMLRSSPASSAQPAAPAALLAGAQLPPTPPAQGPAASIVAQGGGPPTAASSSPTSGPDVAEAPVSADGVLRIRPSDAKALIDRGEAVLYDTRSPDAYQDKHALGAVSFVGEDLEGLLGALPSDKVLIFYCT